MMISVYLKINYKDIKMEAYNTYMNVLHHCKREVTEPLMHNDVQGMKPIRNPQISVLAVTVKRT